MHGNSSLMAKLVEIGSGEATGYHDRGPDHAGDVDREASVCVEALGNGERKNESMWELEKCGEEGE